MLLAWDRRTPPRPARGEGGFTLLEVLVALAVMGIAIQVYVSLFNNSVDLGSTAQHRSLAARFAEDQLNAILRAPDQFRWEVPALGADAVFPVKLAEDDPPAGNPIAHPLAMPPEETAFRREAQTLDKFRWQAFARLPGPNAAYYEITVAVRWKDAARDQVVTMTSAVPRVAVPGTT